MADARGRLEWGQTAEVLAVLYNANRDPKKRPRPFAASDFNPYARGRRAKAVPVTRETWAELRAAFEPPGAGRHHEGR